MITNYSKLFLLFLIGWSLFPFTLFSQNCITNTSDSCQLVALYEQTNGMNWTGQTWDLTMPVTTWSGTQWTDIGGTLHIKTLNLIDRGLIGDISSLSLVLPELEKLYLDNNQLSGQLPHFTATDLPKLKDLTLEANQLTGTIPNLNLPNLEILSLARNKLEGTIPLFEHSNKLSFLSLNHNQLSGTIPDFSQPFLVGLYIHHNQLSGNLPNLPDNLAELWLQNNRFTFSHLRSIKNHSVYTLNSNSSSFIYAPQDSVGQTRTKKITITQSENNNDSLRLAYGGDHYQLFEVGSQQLFFESQSNEILLENINRRHDKTYSTIITNSDFPALTLHHRPIQLSVIGLDFWGASYAPNELIVRFSVNTSEQDRTNLRDEFSADLANTCLNNRAIFELWSFPDPHRIETLSDTFNINGTPSRVKKRSRINDIPVSVGFNYQSFLTTSNNDEPTESILSGYEAPTTGGAIKVALIDSGIQADLAGFQQNSNLNINVPIDHTGNFVDPNSPPVDDFGQGTHIASVISHELSDNIQLELYPLKVYDERGLGTLFNALCALYKAYDIEPDMINFNWHQQSEYDSLLATSLVAAPATTLVVIPAGDQGEDTNDIPHYPTNLDLSNGVMVQAGDETSGTLASFANYSSDSVDVAMHGINVVGYKISEQERNSNQNLFESRNGSAIAAAIFTKKAIYEQLNYGVNGSVLKAHMLSNEVEISSGLMDKNKVGGFISMPPVTSLPIQLSHFSALWLEQQKKVQLTWESSLEQSFSHFEIERADESLVFMTVGNVNSKNAAAETKYQFIDASILPYNSTYFYRLKIIDKDRKFTYSNIQSITINRSNSLHIYPNPFKDKFYVDLGMHASTIVIQLYNSLGQEVRQWTFNNSTDCTLSTATLPKGIYTVSIQADKERINYKIVKYHH